MTDAYFRCPAITTGEWLSGKGQTVYLYQFERPLPGTGSPSTRHSGELPYVFGWAQHQGKGIMGASFGPEDLKLSRQMQEYWTNFAATGNPNGDALPHWPEVHSEKVSLMRFTSEGPVEQSDAARKVCTVYATHLEDLLAKQK
jgi:para-nitrobenzyl esterase